MILQCDPRTRDYKLSKLVAAIRASFESQWQPHEHIANLRKYWSAPNHTEQTAYLQHTTRAALTADGPIIECGSSLSTLLLGLVAEQTGVPVITLEHDPKTYARMRALLQQNHIHHVDLRCTPLVSYGEYDWYNISGDKLPDQIRLVVCDGPPRQVSSGGRYGMWPSLESRMDPACKILLNDYHRKSERQVMEAWSQHVRFQVESFGRLFRYAEITCAN